MARENLIRIGRSPENDVVIADNSVSGFHAMLRVCAGGFYLLSDVGSSNGTFVIRQGQARRISGAERVLPHENIVLGDCSMTLSELLSFAPPHLATPPAPEQPGAAGYDQTRPVNAPVQNVGWDGRGNSPGSRPLGRPVNPELVAAECLGAGPQQGVARVAMGSPVPSREEVVWSGYSALAYWVLGMVWSGLWIVVWMIVAINAAAVISNVPDARRELGAATGFAAVPFLILAFIAGLGLLTKILMYLNVYYEFTSQRVRRREGIFTLRRNHIELFRLKDFEVVETLWGRMFGYCHIRLVSSDRLMPDALFVAVPNGVGLAEEMRRLAQINRAETGVMHLKE